MIIEFHFVFLAGNNSCFSLSCWSGLEKADCIHYRGVRVIVTVRVPSLGQINLRIILIRNI